MSAFQATHPEHAPGGHAPAVPTLQESRRWVRWFTNQHQENFEVLTRLVPGALRSDYAAVYAFCRSADDLADGTGSDTKARELSLQLLAEHREKLHESVRTGGTTSSDPLFVALGDTIRRHELPLTHFDDLLDAFEMDQRVTRHQRWEDLLAYSAKSANPVGRIVLHLHGYGRVGDERRHEHLLQLSDAICTALQLTNFWQDVKRDLVERDRVYLPAVDTGIAGDELRDWMRRSGDPFVRRRYADEAKSLCRRTLAMFASAQELPMLLDRRTGWMIWLFLQGGIETLHAIDRIQHMTLWERATASRGVRLRLLATATIGMACGASPRPRSLVWSR
jgi:squalene synthase HpnC